MTQSKANETELSEAKKIILVAEDDKYFANVYNLKLEKEGYKVAIAENGEDAIKQAQAETPDLILLDLIMPVKDGFETLKELKSVDSLKGVPVVVFSNLGQAEDIERAKQLGASDYFVKTNVSIYEVVDKVKQYLG